MRSRLAVSGSVHRVLEGMVARLERVEDRQLFWFAVLWVVIGGLALQLLVLPYVVPFAHAGHGLIANVDSAGFHATSVELAESIRREGLTAWWFVKDGTNDYVVAVSSLFYLIHPEPWLLLPFSGVLFGITVVTVRRALAVLSDSRGVALVSLLPFFVFPSFVMIWGQPHKDLNAGMGFSLVLYALVLAAYGTGKAAKLPVPAFLGGVGMSIMWLSRPYALSLVAAGTLVFMALALFSRQTRRGRLLTVVAAVLLVAATFERRFDFTVPATAATASAEAGAADLPGPRSSSASVPGSAPALSDDGSLFRFPRWPRYRRIDRSVPTFENCLPAAHNAIDTFLFNLCLVRQGYIGVGEVAGSSNDYDHDIRLRSAEDFVAYIPRAVAFALLEPGPQRWGTERTTLGRLASLFVPFEMIIAYTAFLLALIFGRRRLAHVHVWAVAAFCITYMVIYAVATPQIGNLYRMRAFAFAIMIATAITVAMQGFRRAATPVREPRA